MKKNILLIITALAISTATVYFIVSMKQKVDTIILNGVVYTVDQQNTVAEAIAIRGARIVGVGSTQDIQKRYTSQNIIDVQGKTIIPGFIDSHAHVLALGASLVELNLAGTKSSKEIVEMVASRAKTVHSGQWIRGRGWDQNAWGSIGSSKTYPTAAMLDAVTPSVPVILSRVDGHAIWVNSAAMKIAGIDSKPKNFLRGIEGGKVFLDGNDKPTGIFIDNAIPFITSSVPPYSKKEQRAALEHAFQRCLSVGLTSVHDMGIDEDGFENYLELRADHAMPIRVYAMIEGDSELWKKFLITGPMVDNIQHRLTVRGIKLYIDGALGSRGAALIEPYSDEPDNRGLTVTTADNLREAVHQAIEYGFQVCTHAIGDRGNHIVLNTYEEALAKAHFLPEQLRLRIEHAQVLDQLDIPRFKKLGIIPSMQPAHCTSDMYWAQSRLGPERIKGAYAWRSLLSTGTIIASGSDFPVEQPNPLFGFYAAVTRRDQHGIPRNADDVAKYFQLSPDGIKDSSYFQGGWFPQQVMTRSEALKSFTVWGAYAEFCENEKGSIERGKLADLVLLSKDIMKIPPSEILSTEIEMVIVGGTLSYTK